MVKVEQLQKKYLGDQVVLAVIGLILIYALGLLMFAYADGKDIGAWIWERHQNQFSWYSRPLFVIPACYYAYRRKIWHVLGINALLATSLFWFAAPETVSDAVSGYLEWEKQLFFVNESRTPLFVLCAAVLVFLVTLYYTFWHRNPWFGLLLINIGTILKIIVSVGIGKDLGMAAIVPSVSSLVCINLFAFIVWRFLKTKNRSFQRFSTFKFLNRLDLNRLIKLFPRND